jgi:hypothetical protein
METCGRTFFPLPTHKYNAKNQTHLHENLHSYPY